MLIWELSFHKSGIKMDAILKDGQDLSNIFVFEILLLENFELEAYFEYHKEWIIEFVLNPHTPVAQEIADEDVFRHLQGEGVEFF